MQVVDPDLFQSPGNVIRQGTGDAVFQSFKGTKLKPDGKTLATRILYALHDLCGKAHSSVEIVTVFIVPSIGMGRHEFTNQVRMPTMNLYAVKTRLFGPYSRLYPFLNEIHDFFSREFFRYLWIERTLHGRRCNRTTLGSPASEKGKLHEEPCPVRFDLPGEIFKLRNKLIRIKLRSRRPKPVVCH